MEEDNNQVENKEQLQKAKNDETNAKAVKVAAKGVANYFTAGQGGAVVDAVSNTKLGGAVLDKGGKIVSKISKKMPMGNMLQNTLNKANDSGVLDAADKAMDMTSAAGAAKGAASSSALQASNLDKIKDGANAVSNLEQKEKSNKEEDKSLLKSKNIPLGIKLKLAVGVACAFFFMMLIMVVISPSAGAMLDLTSGGNASGNASTQLTPYTKEEVEKALIYVGDSRTVGMQSALNNASIGFIAESGMGYNYLIGTASSSLDTMLTEDKEFVVMAFGVNDLGNIDSYINAYNALILKYPKVKFYFMSVNPVDETKEAENGYSVTNTSIGSFNQKLSSTFGDKYIDTYSKITSNFNTSDGLHYDNDTYKKIHDIVIEYIKSKNSKASGATTLENYPANTESKELINMSLLEAIGEDGIAKLTEGIEAGIGSGCSGNSVVGAAIGLIYGLHQMGYHLPYYYGGGHGANVIVDPNWGKNIGASIVKPSGNVDYYSGLDCSGFVSWAMNASKISGVYGAHTFKELGNKIAMSEATPGDVLSSSGHVILIIENKGTYLQTAESTGGGVQFSTHNQNDITSGGYTVVDMDNYYQTNCTS